MDGQCIMHRISLQLLGPNVKEFSVFVSYSSFLYTQSCCNSSCLPDFPCFTLILLRLYLRHLYIDAISVWALLTGIWIHLYPLESFLWVRTCGLRFKTSLESVKAVFLIQSQGSCQQSAFCPGATKVKCQFRLSWGINNLFILQGWFLLGQRQVLTTITSKKIVLRACYRCE